jgi:hypothetical protein
MIDELRDTVRRFCMAEIAPLARRIDQEDWFARELWPKLGALGVLGPTVPEAYGGPGLGYLAHAVVSEEPGARIAFRFHARDVNLVMGPVERGSSIGFHIFPDGKPATEAHGTDLGADGTGTLDDQRTYQLVRQRGPIVERTIEIEFVDAGTEAYCFTFG